MDWIVQKSVELGVSEIVPMATARAVVKLDEKKAKKKTERWQAVSESAAKQAGRGKIPEVKQVMGFSEALTYAGTLDHVLIPYELAEGMEETRRQIFLSESRGSIGNFDRPGWGDLRWRKWERLWSWQELFQSLFGKRILRTETAGLFVLSVLSYLMEP